MRAAIASSMAFRPLRHESGCVSPKVVTSGKAGAVTIKVPLSSAVKTNSYHMVIALSPGPLEFCLQAAHSVHGDYRELAAETCGSLSAPSDGRCHPGDFQT